MRKVLYCNSDGIIFSEGYNIIKQTDVGFVNIGSIIDFKYSLFAKYKFTRRFLRSEITGLYFLKNNDIIALGKKGLFIHESTGKDFYKTFAIHRGSKPLNLCILPNGHIYFGEYFQNIEKEKVHIYGSIDNGRTWNVVYTFSAGNINHIHGVFYDKYTNCMWVLTGDRDNECIIGYTDDEFKSFHEVLRGGQEFRSCQLFFYKDFIVYATDSQYIENEIRAIDRETLEITILTNIQGSAIKGGQTENVSYISTTIEPSEINKDRFSHIWVSKDGLHWEEKFKAEKDCWPAIFQYGTFEFPQNAYCCGKLWFSGRALKGYDNQSMYIEL